MFLVPKMTHVWRIAIQILLGMFLNVCKKYIIKSLFYIFGHKYNTKGVNLEDIYKPHITTVFFP